MNKYRGFKLPEFAPVNGRTPFVVAIEGPNGAGKTTLCRRLGRRFGSYTCLGTPPAWFSKALKGRMIRDADWVASAMFFLSGCLEQMRAVKARAERLVIMDRSLWSTLAVHAAEARPRLAAVLAMLKPVARGISVPDLTVVLEASFETCQHRIARKGYEAQALDHLTADVRFHAQEQSFYHWLSRNARRIEFLNVDEASPQRVADQAAALITHAFPLDTPLRARTARGPSPFSRRAPGRT